MKKLVPLLIFIMLFQNIAFGENETLSANIENNLSDIQVYNKTAYGYSISDDDRDNFAFSKDDGKDFSYYDFVDVEQIESYNSSDEGYVTSVKNQKSTSNCWAFAATSVLETALIKNGFAQNNIDLSENHIKYTMISDSNSPYGYDFAVNNGGVCSMAISYYMNDCGPVLEEYSQFSTENVIEDYGATANYPKLNYDINSVIALPSLKSSDRIGLNDNKRALQKKVKELVYKYGSVYGSIYSDNNYITNGNIYYTDSDENNIYGTNHAVTIVGWDDNYSKENFKPVNGEYPAENGAFIIKNSWGVNSGINGYYYISYCDIYSCESVMSICDISEKDNNKIVNTHTGSYFLGGNIESTSDYYYYGNVYSKNYDDEKLDEVSLYMYADQTYDIVLRQADISVLPIQFSNGVYNQVCFKTDTIKDDFLFGGISPDYDGYYTLPLEESIDLTSDKYAIFIKTTKLSDKVKLPFESDVNVKEANGTISCRKHVTCNEMESFYASDIIYTGGNYYCIFNDCYDTQDVNFEVNAITSSAISKSQIDYMSIVNEGNQKITSFEAGSTVKIAPVVNGINLNGKDLVCAVYNGNRLVKTFMKTIENNENIFEYENIPSDFSNYEIKAFVLDLGENKVTPLGDVKIYE